MFSELFQTIYEHIWEFLLGLGLSASTIYLFWRIIKGAIYLIFFKKKRQLEKKANNEALANLVVDKLTAKYQPIIDEMKAEQVAQREQLTRIENKLNNSDNEQIEELSVEVRAYQKVMLAQDSDLQLQYEQIKSGLIQASKDAKAVIADITETTSTVANNLTEAVEENEENILTATEDVANTVKKVKNTAKKAKERAKKVIYG